MSEIGITFISVFGLLMLMASRRWAALVLLLSAIYVTRGQILEIESANFTIPRMLVLIGYVRVLMRRERMAGGMHTIDWLVLLWAAILVGTSAFHTPEPWVYRSGLVWTEVGSYFLFRVFLQDLGDVQSVFGTFCIAVVPVAVLMLIEKSTGENLFGVLGGVNKIALVRNDQIRASGPFAHPILAGTVGAACVAMGLSLWKRSRGQAWAGLAAGIGIVYACTSSGPILMVLFIVLGLSAWLVRRHMRLLRGLAITSILGLAIIMNDPVYFLMSRIDITGGSAGYFRAQLIRSSVEHLSEWWLAGTDYTRHWMPTGIYANSEHTDITNHILAMGIMGGLALMFVFLLILAITFRDVGRAVEQYEAAPIEQRFLLWSLGALLFGFFATFWSISLFDQSVIFFWFTVAAIESSLRTPRSREASQPMKAPALGIWKTVDR